MLEKSLWIADARDRVHLALQKMLRSHLLLWIEQVVKNAANEPHLEDQHCGRQLFMWEQRGAVGNDGVGAFEPARRLAQWDGRQQHAVAEAALAIDHRDFDVARERIVLQAVVIEDYAAIGI